MSAVDRCDQYQSSYDIGRKSQKWWKKVFGRMLELCVINSCIFRSLHPEITGEKINRSHRKFRQFLIHEWFKFILTPVKAVKLAIKSLSNLLRGWCNWSNGCWRRWRRWWRKYWRWRGRWNVTKHWCLSSSRKTFWSDSPSSKKSLYILRLQISEWEAI